MGTSCGPTPRCRCSARRARVPWRGDPAALARPRRRDAPRPVRSPSRGDRESGSFLGSAGGGLSTCACFFLCASRSGPGRLPLHASPGYDACRGGPGRRHCCQLPAPGSRVKSPDFRRPLPLPGGAVASWSECSAGAHTTRVRTASCPRRSVGGSARLPFERAAPSSRRPRAFRPQRHGQRPTGLHPISEHRLRLRAL